MVYERTQTYELKEKSLDNFQSIIETILEDSLKRSTKTVKLDESLTIITFLDDKKDASSQKDNKVSLYQEQGNLFIQLKGDLTEGEAADFWTKISVNLEKQELPPIEKKPDIQFTEEEIVEMIISSITDRGYTIDRGDAENFVSNFESEYNRLPGINQIDSIAQGYVQMMQEIQPSSSNDPVPASTSNQEEMTKVSNSMISEPIGSNFQEESTDLSLSSEKIEPEAPSTVPSKQEIMEKIEEWDSEDALRRLRFLSNPTINIITKMIQKLPGDRQKEIILRVVDVKEEIDDCEEEHGIEIAEWERNEYLVELIKLTKRNRKEKLLDLIQEKKQEMIVKMIHEEIPQIKHDDNEKIIKELLWLTKSEIDARIEKLKEKVSKKLEKKQELFSKSSAGTTCPNCGWPVGRTSKKCIRCGHKLIDWL